MEIDITSSPAYSIAYVRLAVGESFVAERGAMVAMSQGVQVSASVDGGVVRAALRKALVDESFLFVRFVSQLHGAWVSLAPKFPGDVARIDLVAGHDLLVQSGSVLGYASSVETSAKLGSLGTVLLKEGVTVLRASGQGPLLVCAYGGLERFEVAQDQRLIVDTGHLAAWSASMGLRVGPLSGLVSAAMTGEGLVGELTGPGTVWIQTRAERQLRSWLFPERAQDAGR